MVLYLRSNDNKTIVDLEITGRTKKDVDISSVVDIKEYTKKFISLFMIDKEEASRFTDEMEYVQEIRGWLFETYLNEVKDNFSYNELLDMLKSYFKYLAEKYNLFVVED